MKAENYIYLDYMEKWKNYIDLGRIGNIHYAEAEYVHDIRERLYDTGTRPGESYWRTYRPPIHYCTHCLGPLMYLIGQGDYITKTTAWGNKATIVEDQALWPSTIDMQVAVFETKQGRILKILRSQVTPRENHIVTYQLFGTKGSLETGRAPGYDNVGYRYFEGFQKKDRLVEMNCNGTKLDAPLSHKFGGHGTSDYYGAQAFLDYVEFGKEPYTTVERAVELTLPGIIAHEAAVKGHVWMDIPHL
jgi:predicted dehydrogenase